MLVGLLGEGIRQSLTPPMHRSEAAHMGLDYEYRVIDTAETGEGPDDLPAILARVDAEGYDAINVTHPFKQRIIDHIDTLSPAAEQLGAVNLVVFTPEGAVGHNTDWSGFRTAIELGIGALSGQRVVQIGAGGAGAATSYALLTLGLRELRIADRRAVQAEELVTRLALRFPGTTVSAVALDAVGPALEDTDGVVHATPTGMALSPGMPFSLDSLAPAAWVSEVVYLPFETELLREARRRGHRVLDGGQMAVGQAADSLRIITGREPDRARMRNHFVELVSAQQGGS